MIGRVLSGRYAIEAVVGTGGMAVVYRAWDRQNARTVAIKVLRPEYEQDEEFVRRFSREAEAAAKMSHENIVNLLAVGKDDNMRFIVMEYVDGQTLKDMIRERGRIRPDIAVRMAIRTLAAVDHAHKNGIVHRDIKPQNILVDAEGTVKVADFGIARLKTAQTTRIDDGQNSALGSVHYFSPEQASGEVADEKSDLYSVGVVIYEMLTGKVPFDGETAVSVALKHVSEDPKSMRETVPAISRALDEVVMRALSKDSEKRYQTAAEMAGDLRLALVRPKGGFVKYPQNKEEIEQKRELQKRRMQRQKKRLRTLTRIATACILLVIALSVIWYFVRVYDMHTVPLVIGTSEQAAVSAITEAGLTPETVRAYSEDTPLGTVISQSVDAGVRKKGASTVKITVSAGSQWIYLEDMSNLTLEEVYEKLSALGVMADVVSVEYVLSDLEPGHVVSQSVEPGWITRETAVVLQVSAKTVLAPPLTGLTLDGAKALIESNGLLVGTVSEAYSADAAAGTIIAQSVAPGAKVMVGGTIDLTVSQSQDSLFYPAVDYTVSVPLDGISVRLEITRPSGETFDGYNGVLNEGTYSVQLSSGEKGAHTVREYFDGILMSETIIYFE